MGTPYKMKGSPMARNFGAPFKKDTTQKITKGTSKNIHNPGPTTKVTTTTPTGTSFVETSDKTGRVLSEGGGNTKKSSKSSKTTTKPKTVDLTKRQDVTKYVKGTKAYKAANPSKATKILNTVKKFAPKVTKFLGGKALGVAGMLQATSSKADQPKKGQGAPEYPGGKFTNFKGKAVKGTKKNTFGVLASQKKK